MSGTLIVGIDGTESSRAALRWAMKQAVAIGAEVNLTHVIDDEWATIGARMLEELTADAVQLLAREADYASSLDAEVVVHTQSLHGDVMQELIAASKQAEMVIVGTHKTGFISGKVYGSRSLRLAASAHSPVAVIPQGTPRDGRGIIAGADDSAAGRLAVRLAAQEAERTGENLTLVRAFTVPEFSATNDALRRESIKLSEERTLEILSDAATLARLTAPTVEVKTRSVWRPTAQALVDAAATAALLVIGNSRRDDVDNGMVGSVSHDVLINLTGPAIIVHARDPQ
ncbi:MAG: universal stress protein [Lacisediminihabitans sp.]